MSVAQNGSFCRHVHILFHFYGQQKKVNLITDKNYTNKLNTLKLIQMNVSQIILSNSKFGDTFQKHFVLHLVPEKLHPSLS